MKKMILIFLFFFTTISFAQIATQEEKMSVGSYGSTLITTTTTVTGNFFAIQVLADAVIDSLVDAKMTGDPSNLNLSAGTFIYGNFTKIKLKSGSVIAYKRQ